MEGTDPQEEERADRVSRSINFFERLRHEVQRRGTSQADRCPPQAHQLADVSKLHRADVEPRLRCVDTSIQNGHRAFIESQIFSGFLNELRSSKNGIPFIENGLILYENGVSWLRLTPVAVHSPDHSAGRLTLR